VAANSAAEGQRAELLQHWRAAELPVLTPRPRPRDLGPAVPLIALAEILVDGVSTKGANRRPSAVRLAPNGPATSTGAAAAVQTVQEAAPIADSRAGPAEAPEVAPAPAVYPGLEKKPQPVRPPTVEESYLQSRLEGVRKHFPTATPVDDFLFRLEMALCAFGFDGANSIGVVNLCRDEATNPLRQKIEEIFPLVFNINGLGGGLTCGVTGMGAGLSHSPVFPANANGRKRYIFFSCPHIAIDSAGNVGSCSRPGQIATNAACGAMIGALGQFQAEGLEAYAKKADSVHDAADPEYSIFKQRLASRVLKEKKQLKDIDLVELTKIAERQISADLDFLISKAVSVEDADYAVVTGVQIHNWGEKFDNEEPNLEMVAPTKVMVVVNGEKTVIDLKSLPSPSPRQLRILTKQVGQDSTSSVAAFIGDRTVTDINGRGPFSSDHSAKAADQKKREATFFKMLLESEGL